MKSIAAAYNTNQEKEKSGILVQFDGFRIFAARAGGSNKEFLAAMQKALADVDVDSMPEETREEMLAPIICRVYAQTIVKRWQTETEDGVYEDGMCLDGESLVVMNEDDVTNTLLRFNEIFQKLAAVAGTKNPYLESAAKN